MFGIIYITTNLINNKKYIGKHKCDSIEFDGYLGSGKALKNAIKKYGRKNFIREVLDTAKSLEELNDKEIYYIDKYDAMKNDNFYNIRNGGEGVDFNCLPEETKELIRAKNRINLKGKNNGMYGKHHSKETIQKIINNRDLSVYHTEEFKKKMSKVTKGENNGMYGRHHTEESKKKMSENSKGKNIGSANGNFGNKGDKAKNGKKCYCYLDEEHKILFKEFNTLDLALSFLNMKGHTGILKAIKNNKKYKGYYWSR